jgi:DNA-binding transcriptional LysR family regulator
VAREVCTIDWILCASADYFEGRAPINCPADLASQIFIGGPPSQESTIELRNRNDDTDAQLVQIQPTLQSADYPFLLEAVQDGMGIGILPAYVMCGPAGQNLKQVLPQYRIVGQLNRLYILTLPSRFPSPAKRALMEYLEKELLEYAASWK